MVSFYIDPYGVGDGSSDLNPAASLPATLVNGTNYLFKPGTTYNRGASAISLSSKAGITFDTWYGEGKATVITNPGVIVFSTGGTTADLAVKNLILENSGANAIYLNSPLTSLDIEDIDFAHPAGSTSNIISFAAAQNLSHLRLKNLDFTNGNRAISLLCSVANLVIDDFLIDGITVTGLLDRIVRLTTESANDAWLSSVINNLTIRNVNADRNYGGIWVRSGYDPNYWNPPVRGANLVIEDINIENSAEFSDNTLPGGVNITGFEGVVRRVRTYNVTAQGAAISGTTNRNLIYEENYCEHTVSVAQDVNGKYIDSLGIFCDQGNQNCTVRYNTIVDCPGYNIEDDPAKMASNSGGGIGLWNCGNNDVYGNVIKDSRYGVTYGNVNETGNRVFNNTDIGCVASLKKYGSSALAGSLTQKNNASIGSTTLFEYTSNPSCTQVTNEQYATAAEAGVILDANGIPIRLTADSPLRRAGTDMSAYYEDADGNAFQSPPNVGAFQERSLSGVSGFLGRVFAP